MLGKEELQAVIFFFFCKSSLCEMTEQLKLIRAYIHFLRYDVQNV